MCKTTVYTLVDGGIQGLTHQKQQKVILFSSALTHRPSRCNAGNMSKMAWSIGYVTP